jgi:hypothetical protein
MTKFKQLFCKRLNLEFKIQEKFEKIEFAKNYFCTLCLDLSIIKYKIVKFFLFFIAVCIYILFILEF